MIRHFRHKVLVTATLGMILLVTLFTMWNNYHAISSSELYVELEKHHVMGRLNKKDYDQDLLLTDVPWTCTGRPALLAYAKPSGKHLCWLPTSSGFILEDSKVTVKMPLEEFVENQEYTKMGHIDPAFNAKLKKAADKQF